MAEDNGSTHDPGKTRVLIIDDDKGMSYTLSRMVNESGRKAKTAFTLSDGLECLRGGDFDVVFLDVKLPDGSGLDIIPKIQALPFPPEIIIITAFGEKNGAAEALKSGVWDFIEKPARIDTLKLSLQRALQYRSHKEALHNPSAVDRSGIVGSSARLQMCITLMGHAAKSDANVLIRGETGTGKELFAKAIHQNSTRASNPFIVVDCTSLPQSLAESILFGHARGAFTGAESHRVGLVQQAHGGTLFLDEVGELPLDLQKKFLRVLQERCYRPVGGEQEMESNFRLVSATNRDLETRTEEGRFRQDLLFRLGSFVIELPALKNRSKDIDEIAAYYVDRLCTRHGIETKKMSEEFLEMLHHYSWPGNVRELAGTIERAVVMEIASPMLYPKHLPDHIRAQRLDLTMTEKPMDDEIRPAPVKQLESWKTYRQQALVVIEKRYIRELMETAGDDIQKACEISGLKRARLYQLLKRYR